MVFRIDSNEQAEPKHLAAAVIAFPLSAKHGWLQDSQSNQGCPTQYKQESVCMYIEAVDYQLWLLVYPYQIAGDSHKGIQSHLAKEVAPRPIFELKTSFHKAYQNAHSRTICNEYCQSVCGTQRNWECHRQIPTWYQTHAL